MGFTGISGAMDLMRLEQEDRNTGWDADEGTDEETFTMLSIEFYYANGNFIDGTGLVGGSKTSLDSKILTCRYHNFHSDFKMPAT